MGPLDFWGQREEGALGTVLGLGIHVVGSVPHYPRNRGWGSVGQMLSFLGLPPLCQPQARISVFPVALPWHPSSTQ